MKRSPKIRILEIAKNRFYRQGYHHTGINQIIRESATAKASFYDHFPSKQTLGVQVIRAYGVDVLVWFRKILRNSSTPNDFISEMSKAMLDQVRTNDSYYQGCPIAIFSSQFPVGEKPFSDEFKRIVIRWESILTSAIQKWKSKGLLQKNTKELELARDLINLYEGSLMNWRISMNEDYILRAMLQIKERFKTEIKK
ncbi:TetR/AcrR family transcriptional regulator [Leptospira levettii]|uniref:TetR/AcrR family transcriptional regulator n=1 Tax=Leptospira levettii TaxID=2023178 RepID=UPI000C2960C1|nr:TetR/AcrR family transcriptional regulator [Leptospira levettii]MCG6149588.1 TetR/AcrR family transcriptional regulator [Leptospira levettii]MCW7509553.1 TetR/AcrR family transcriptional regulator [Leptospira levettii]MCW7520624.1 TetR/AcrR family transcriptional regulator [Leptospira levettii]PJZ90003.1 TetR family transcriptional regulator [Leptospira levettii]TGL11130.1 TetR/AcrR family transcriptional regulator [Leptospira levettii]